MSGDGTSSERRWLDAPGPERDGEQLDRDALATFLRAAIPGLDTEELDVEQFRRGYSNLTYLVHAGARGLVLRRPPFGVEIATAHDMFREYRILSHLAPVYDKAPAPLAFCDDPGVLGASFYVMERVEGVILRKEMPPEMAPDPDRTRAIAFALVDALAELHAVDYEGAGLGELGRPVGYVRRQVEGWAKRYTRARTDDIPEIERAAVWLRDHMPSERAGALIHNDFKHDNVVLDPGDWSRLIAVLDWEMATLGDPLMDLGTSLAYWTQPDDPPALVAARLSPTTLAGTPRRTEIVERYAAASGVAPDDVVFYYAYGLVKVAVIVQQLYARYAAGHTRDPRFASLLDGVRALSAMAWHAIQTDRIDGLGTTG